MHFYAVKDKKKNGEKYTKGYRLTFGKNPIEKAGFTDKSQIKVEYKRNKIIITKEETETETETETVKEKLEKTKEQPIIEYVVIGEESGEVKSFKTRKEAEKFMTRDLKPFDKRHGIQDTYFIQEKTIRKAKKVKSN